MFDSKISSRNYNNYVLFHFPFFIHKSTRNVSYWNENNRILNNAVADRIQKQNLPGLKIIGQDLANIEQLSGNFGSVQT